MGASGAIPKSDYVRRNNFAEEYYESVRNRKGDVERISQNTGIDKNDVLKVYKHVFINEYFLDGKMQKFDPSYEQAVVWQRLSDGKNIKDTDILFLMHELAEYEYMNSGFDYITAHNLANKKYNWWDSVKDD
jgi:hypothetical protein